MSSYNHSTPSYFRNNQSRQPKPSHRRQLSLESYSSPLKRLDPSQATDASPTNLQDGTSPIRTAWHPPGSPTRTGSPRTGDRTCPIRTGRRGSNPTLSSSYSGSLSSTPENFSPLRNSPQIPSTAIFGVLEGPILYIYSSHHTANLPAARQHRATCRVTSPTVPHETSTATTSATTTTSVTQSTCLTIPLTCLSDCRSVADLFGPATFLLTLSRPITGTATSPYGGTDTVVLQAQSVAGVNRWLFELSRSLRNLVNILLRPSQEEKPPAAQDAGSSHDGAGSNHIPSSFNPASSLAGLAVAGMPSPPSLRSALSRSLSQSSSSDGAASTTSSPSHTRGGGGNVSPFSTGLAASPHNNNTQAIFTHHMRHRRRSSEERRDIGCPRGASVESPMLDSQESPQSPPYHGLQFGESLGSSNASLSPPAINIGAASIGGQDGQTIVPMPTRGKYVPPHMRGNAARPPPPPAFADEGELAESSEFGVFEISMDDVDLGRLMKSTRNLEPPTIPELDQPRVQSVTVRGGCLAMMPTTSHSLTCTTAVSTVTLTKRMPSYEVGGHSCIGIRGSNEDAYLLGAGPQSGVIGVFDGHCGKEAAIYLGDNVLKYVEQNKSGAQVVDGLAALDEEFCKMCKVIGLDCGATAIVGTLSEETGRLTVTNIGDCHAIIIRLTQATPPGKAWQSLPTSGLEHLKFRELSLTHKPDDDDEGMRITEGGGWITSESEICIAQLSRLDWQDEDVLRILRKHAGDDVLPGNAPGRVNSISRVCGELAVSRAIGDVDFKQAFNSPDQRGWWTGPDFLPYPEDHDMKFNGDLITARGTSDSEKVEVGDIAVFVCDGVSDVLDMDDLARIAAEHIILKGRSAKEAAKRICELSVQLGSSDNVTCVLVHFGNGN